MRVCIITNQNGIGLTRDWELLRDFLSPAHEVVGIQYDRALPDGIGTFDLALYLEVIPRNLLELAPVRWAFLNPEFATPVIVKTAQRHIHKIFAKTKEAKRIFEEVFPGKTHYVGFMARDQFEPGTERQPWFLNIGGNSSIRGTQEVLDAWKWKKNGQRIESQLFIISSVLQERPDLPNVHIWDRVTEVQLKLLQNQCAFHLFPSGTEGFGHSLHEAQGVGALILTTDAPPMNEMEYVYQIPSVGKTKCNLADVYEVSALDIFDGVNELLECWEDGKNWSTTTLEDRREYFLAGNENFKAAFSAHLEDFNPKPVVPVIRTKGTGLQIAFIGNFKAEHSTENQIRWALEEGLGHDVEMLQENEVNLAAIRTAMEFSDLLCWVRTPGWLHVSGREMLELIEGAKIPTVSVHLDKFWGIPEREALIGTHPFFKTKFVFTADGSRDEDFKARDVNHFWMRPAVSEVYCHPGQPWDMYRCDVGFVGAKDYHNEHPFRRRLVEFLENTYGDRFKHITGLRGHGLNDFYASCKITIGDCFGGGAIPYYWSDRVPETCGRYGFLLHPFVEGLVVPVAKYNPLDLESLEIQIRYFLENPKEREQMRRECAAHVREYDTWTVRMKWIIETVQKGLSQASHA